MRKLRHDPREATRQAYANIIQQKLDRADAIEQAYRHVVQYIHDMWHDDEPLDYEAVNDILVQYQMLIGDDDNL